MVINNDRRNYKGWGYIVFCVGLLVINGLNGLVLAHEVIPNSSDVSQTLIDKVFTFSAPKHTRYFNDLYFYEEYTYYLTIEIVTPHDCAINITLTDPKGYNYSIFKTEVNVSQDDGWFEIPFGTACSGNYTIEMDVISSLTLNIHIKLIKDHKCLYDIIPPTLLGTLKFYNVVRFTNSSLLSHNVQLRTDYSYKFFIARVSSIGGMSTENEVDVFYNLTDPEANLFQIYVNETLVPIGSVLSFDFGTAMEGLYQCDLKIFCEIECVNIAYAISEDYRLSDVINGTVPLPEPLDNNTIPRGLIIMPSQFTLGMIIGCVSITAISAIAIMIKNKKASRFLRR